MKCDSCGLPTAQDEMIQFEGRWICAACKPAFVQRLKEGVLQPLPETLPEIFEDRVLGFGELVVLSWKVLRQDWMALLGLVILFGVPVNLILLFTEPTGAPPTMRDVGRSIGVQQAIETLLGVLAPLGIAKIVSERLLGRKAGFADGFTHAVRRWLPAIGTGILEAVILLLLLFLLVVPGVIWAVYFSFWVTVVSLRGRAGKTALEYSKALVKGRWWGVFGRMLGLFGIALVPMILVEIFLEFVPVSGAVSFVSSMLTDVCYLFTSVGATILFLNLDAVHRNDPVFDAWRARP